MLWKCQTTPIYKFNFRRQPLYKEKGKAMAFDRREFSASEARMALVDLLSAFQGPAYLPRLEKARAEAGNDMVKQVELFQNKV